jgi:CheY-like chemotaxis protein
MISITCVMGIDKTPAAAEVTLAENGQIAVARALAAIAGGQPFDLVLMDMQMPELDGYGATATLRAAEYRGPIVALTAHAMAADRDRCISAGCDDYLTKPIKRDELVEGVLRGIARRAIGVPARRISVPDAAPLVSDLVGDPDLAELVDEFVADLPTRSAALQTAVRDMAEVCRLAHQMKGSAGGFGFAPITAVAADIEQAAKSGAEALDLGRRIAELSGLCARARARM